MTTEAFYIFLGIAVLVVHWLIYIPRKVAKEQLKEDTKYIIKSDCNKESKKLTDYKNEKDIKDER
ncbi:hypothetical protein [Kordia sp.]|uniref:hypothetical protein n=1 Tax=Kordia sp. TaxID=1965332 RepID=UPI003D6B95D3